MDIIKAFEHNDLNIHITIQGSREEPLFRASDIGEVLGLKHIHTSINDFDSTQKVLRAVVTRGGKQEVTFLTEFGLYKILFRSKKEIANKFQNWACEVIKEIRLNGVYQLQKQIIDVIKEKEQTLLKNFSKKSIVYIGYAEDNIIKFGYTDDLETRIRDHKREIKPDWTPHYVYESFQNKEIERRIKKCNEIQIITKTYNSKKQTELIKLNDNITIDELDRLIRQIKHDIESSKDYVSEIDKLKADNAELKLKLETAENAAVIDLQLNSMQSINTKLHEMKKAVCYNFLVYMVANEIVSKNGNLNIQIKLSIDEIFQNCKQFRIANRYQDPIFDESYEKSIITKAFNEVDGITNTYKTIDGIHSRAKLFYIDKISEWICKNLQIPKRFRSIFREIAKEVVFTNIYCPILNQEIEEKNKHVYSFLIDLLNTEHDEIFIMKNTIITEKYLKFAMQHNQKKMTMINVSSIFINIPGISLQQRITDNNYKYCRGLKFSKLEINKWIKDNITT